MLSTAKVNIHEKNPEVLLNRQSKRTRNVIKSISDREIYQLICTKSILPRDVTKMGEGGGGGGKYT